MSPRRDPLAGVWSPPAGAGPPVLILHSWWGLTPSFAAYATALAERGFVAACVDLYGGRVATTETEARALRRARRSEPVHRTLQRALIEVAALGDGGPAAVIGFSMGGHWAVWLAQHPGPPVGAAVLYYAARGGDFAAATAPVLAHFADHDPFVSTSARRAMARALRTRGLPFESHDYPGTGHWFAESDSPAFDPAAAALALDRTVAFLPRTSPPSPR